MPPLVERPSPTGVVRALLRLPVWLYRARLGWVLGARFLLLAHRGRASGRMRYSVLEVVHRDPRSGACFVASGWGERADWLRNVERTPAVTVQVGRRRFPATAERLPAAAAADVLLAGARRHPRAFRILARLIIGRRLQQPTADDCRALAASVPVVALRARPAGRSPARGRGAAAAVLAALALALAGAGPAPAGPELTLSVAISMKDAIEDLGRRFAATRPGVTLRYNLGASGALQKQIEAGAPVDLFISAADREMDELERRGLILGQTRRAFARNVLVVITPAEAPAALAGPAALLDGRVRRIVIGDPKTVPAGQYAEESLRALGLWDRIQTKLVLAENVRQVLDYVVRGEVDAGFVYATDAAARRGRVREAFRPAEATYRPVIYPAAVVAGSRQASLARAFVDYLVSPEGQAVLRTHGFRPPPPGAR